MNFKLDHVGWVTNNLEKFEHFWCTGLGFEMVWESHISPLKVKALFGIEHKTFAKRYQKDGVVIEVHMFTPPLTEEEQKFCQFGLNHIGLWTEDRDAFIEELRSKIGYVEVRRYYDPAGWWNMFLRDYDGNWIELRTTL